MKPHLDRLEPQNFSFVWTHPDPRMDRLQVEVAAIVHDAASSGEPAERTFARIRGRAAVASGTSPKIRESRFPPARERSRPPRLTEPWFC
jgi:hypothetical protein